MLTVIPEVLNRDQVLQARRALDAAEWVDGNVTSGQQAAQAKRNMQLPQQSQAAREVGALILDALGQHPLFIAAALPHRVLPPLFNRYQSGEHFGVHIDNAIRAVPGTGQRIRTDLSATLFFADPDEYEGGELIIEDSSGQHGMGQYGMDHQGMDHQGMGEQRIKLPAGHLILYPATSLHRVAPVTRGARVSAFFWIQSMVRDDGERTLLYQLDTAIQELGRTAPASRATVQLTGIYHNLLRRWAEL